MRAPKDGMTAVCPYFRQRKAFRGEHYIECKSPDGYLCSLGYADEARRNQQYRKRCVEGECDLRKSWSAAALRAASRDRARATEGEVLL